MSQTPLIKIATRKSPMAMAQTFRVKQQLQQLQPDLTVEIIGLSTKGDENTKQPLIHLGGKTLFVKELQHALLTDKADIAVHSIKDMSAQEHPKLTLGAICKRDDPRDTLISNTVNNFSELPQGAIIGTSSPRRECQLKALRPDLHITLLRGNANTRLAKLDAGEYDAIILGAAGLERIEQQHRITQYLDTTHFIPAIAQGTIGIECRRNDTHILKLISSLDHEESRAAITTERAVNQVIGGDCHTPIGAYAMIKNNRIHARAMIGNSRGEYIQDDIIGQSSQAQTLGEQLGEMLIAQGARRYLEHRNG